MKLYPNCHIKVKLTNDGFTSNDGYVPECYESDDCELGNFCLNGYCLSNTVENKICDTGSVCGTDNEEVKVDNTNLILSIAGIILFIAVLLIIYFVRKKK